MGLVYEWPAHCKSATLTLSHTNVAVSSGILQMLQTIVISNLMHENFHREWQLNGVIVLFLE